jgi:hypothetical protein
VTNVTNVIDLNKARPRVPMMHIRFDVDYDEGDAPNLYKRYFFDWEGTEDEMVLAVAFFEKTAADNGVNATQAARGVFQHLAQILEGQDDLAVHMKAAFVWQVVNPLVQINKSDRTVEGRLPEDLWLVASCRFRPSEIVFKIEEDIDAPRGAA